MNWLAKNVSVVQDTSHLDVLQDDDKMRAVHQLTSFLVTAANGSGMDCVANWMKVIV